MTNPAILGLIKTWSAPGATPVLGRMARPVERARAPPQRQELTPSAEAWPDYISQLGRCWVPGNYVAFARCCPYR
jgi:hypothetical protein